MLSMLVAGSHFEGTTRKYSTMTDTFDMAALVAQLTIDEKLMRFVYDDKTGMPIRAGSHVLGNPTVGIGRNLSGCGLSSDEAVMLCQNDIARCAAYFDMAIPWWRTLSPVRQRQMLNLGFNMGPGKLVSDWPVFLHAMLVHDWPGAVDALKNSAWWHQVGSRATRVAAAILAG